MNFSPIRFYLFLSALALLAGCSQYSNAPVSRGYHNLTAHYNAYVIARDEIAEAEKVLFKNRQENYNQLLPILLPADSVAGQAVKPQLDDAIRKASLIPERHQNSKWLDNAYILIGRARLLKQDLPNAIEVFKYVNTKGKNEDDRHTALVNLMRTYIEADDPTNAMAVAEYLRNQPLNKGNTRDFYLTKAYLHQKIGEYGTAAAILDATFPALKKGEATARLHLIAGQLYDVIGQPAKALAHYQKVQRTRPSYDQSFYANLYAIQSSGQTTDSKKAARSAETFERMLSDRKNVDLKDKIYSTMAALEARNGNPNKAIDYYRQAIRAAPSGSQAPYTYLEIGRLYFEQKNFAKANVYYDSALAKLPSQSADYKALLARKQTLDAFVGYQTTIQTQDSLLALGKLPPQDLEARINQEIARQNKLEADRVNAERQAATSTESSLMQPGAANSNRAPADRWALYNPVQLSQGRQEFMSRWGNRTLEDDWRRSTKQASNAVAGVNSPLQGNVAANSISPDQPLPVAGEGSNVQVIGGANGMGKKQAMLAQIPTTAEAQAKSNTQIETALYELGKLYKFQFNQPAQAIQTFEQLLSRYPNTLPKPEIYYLLHLSNEQLKQASNWKEKLLAEYPNTSYARLAGQNAQQSSDAEATVQAAYKHVYDLYQTQKNTEALQQAENLLKTYPASAIADKLAMLRLLLLGRLQPHDTYSRAIAEFMRDYPNSPLVKQAQEMQLAAQRLVNK